MQYKKTPAWAGWFAGCCAAPFALLTLWFMGYTALKPKPGPQALELRRQMHDCITMPLQEFQQKFGPPNNVLKENPNSTLVVHEYICSDGSVKVFYSERPMNTLAGAADAWTVGSVQAYALERKRP